MQSGRSGQIPGRARICVIFKISMKSQKSCVKAKENTVFKGKIRKSGYPVVETGSPLVKNRKCDGKEQKIHL